MSHLDRRGRREIDGDPAPTTTEGHHTYPMDEGTAPPRLGRLSRILPSAATRDSRLWYAGLFGLAILAFGIRFVGLAIGGGLDGRATLDEGTYFAAAIAFVNGRLPYRDFGILHPPGLLYLLTPFGQIGTLTTEANGLVLARLAFMVLGAVNTALVGLVGARVGRRTGLIAAALYAVWVLPLEGERGTLLIAPQATAMLVALLALTGRDAMELSTRRVAVAGVAIGVTGAIQIWAVVPATVILAWLVLRVRGRRREVVRVAATYVISGAATAAALLSPLLLSAGPQMIQMIIFAQATRLGRYGTGPLTRLRLLEGLEVGPFGLDVPTPAVLILALAATMLVLFVARRRPAIRWWAAIACSQLAFIMAMPLFIPHYRGWPAPVMALSLGAVVAYGLERVPAHRRNLGLAAYGLILVMLAGTSLRPTGARLAFDADTPGLSPARCVLADEGYLAIRSHTLVRSLRNGCHVLPNPRNMSRLNNAARGGEAQSRRKQEQYQSDIINYFASADVVLLGQLKLDGLTDATVAALRTEFPYEQRIGPVTLLRRDAP